MKLLLENHRCQTPQYSEIDRNRLLDNLLFKDKPKILYPPRIIVRWKRLILKCHHCTMPQILVKISTTKLKLSSGLINIFKRLI